MVALPKQRLIAAATFVFALMLWVAWPLSRVSILEHLLSIESLHLITAQWMAAHWNDWQWFPLWFSGMPLQNVYQGGLPTLSALFSAASGLDAARSFHIICTVLYALGPVGLLVYVTRLSGRLTTGLVSALLWGLVSASGWLIPVIRYDMGSLWFPRRFQALVYYGEGANVCGLSLVPWSLWLVHEACQKPTGLRVIAAVVSLSATMMISIPATLCLVVALGAYLLAHEPPRMGRIALVLTVAGALAYALISPWSMPSTLATNQSNSQMLGGDYRYRLPQLVALGSIALAMLTTKLTLARLKAGFLWQQSLLFLIPLATVTLAAHWFHFSIIPQPERFHLAMEIGFCMVGGLVATALFRVGPTPSFLLFALLTGLFTRQAIVHRHYSRMMTKPANLETRIEKWNADWLRTHDPGARVFATGSVGFYLNYWTPNPQVRGCCMHGLPNPVDWISSYIIPSADGAGTRYAEVASLWLQALGAKYVLVGGPQTGDAYHDWKEPGTLVNSWAVVARHGDDYILRVPDAPESIGHIVPRTALPARTPLNGIDTAPLVPYVSALARAASSLPVTWPNAHEILTRPHLDAPDVLSLQVTYHPGWNATSDGHPIAVQRDALGHIWLDPGAGDHDIHLWYDGGSEQRQTLRARGLAIALLLLYALWSRRRFSVA